MHKYKHMLAIFSRPLTPNTHQRVWLTKNLNSWALAIREASSPQQALHLYTHMQIQRIPFNSYAILFTLKSCTHLHNLTLIRHLHAHIFKIGFSSHVYVATSLLYSYVSTSFDDACHLFDEMPERNTVTWNTMISGYSRSGNVERAYWLFENMPIRNLDSWSAMISGYIGNGNWNCGLTLFREMMANGSLKPDEITLGSILSSCARMGSLGLLLGKSIHCFTEKNGWELNVQLGTVLVDMYTKCGLLRNAFRIFEKMKERNVMTWSAMICGFAQHGCGRKALFMFKKMKEAGIRPNEITFTGILSACTHAGLVDYGLKNFKSMIEEYRLEPRIQHYGCMVDLLGKAGKLEDAYEVIKTMRLEPNVVVWGALLAACKMHRQFEIAERVIEQVLKVITPENDGGVYTLISDIYALNGKWDDAQRVREMMFNQNVKKVRGSSSITS